MAVNTVVLLMNMIPPRLVINVFIYPLLLKMKQILMTLISNRAYLFLIYIYIYTILSYYLFLFFFQTLLFIKSKGSPHLTFYHYYLHYYSIKSITHLSFFHIFIYAESSNCYCAHTSIYSWFSITDTNKNKHFHHVTKIKRLLTM